MDGARKPSELQPAETCSNGTDEEATMGSERKVVAQARL